jgi:hypothetical protein
MELRPGLEQTSRRLRRYHDQVEGPLHQEARQSTVELWRLHFHLIDYSH